MTPKERREYIKTRFENPFKVGDILHHSWGYDQTQCDYYQVVRVTKASVFVLPIAAETVPGSEGFMSRRAIPVKDRFLRNAHTALQEYCSEVPEGGLQKRVTAYVKNDGSLSYYISTPYGCCDKWDGTPQYNSWYA